MTLTKIASTGVEDSLRWVLGANGTSDYTFTGPGLTGTVNDPTIYLTRGHTYIFQNNSGGHPFYIKTSIANGGTNDAYNTGVTNNGGGNGTEIVFTVPHDSPDILYYQCSSHASMAGQFNIAGSVADGSITTAKIADDAVTNAKLADDSVSYQQIVNGAVGVNEIATNAVTTTKIADSQVTTAKINDDAVTQPKIASNAVTTDNIANNAVTTATINNNAVTTAKIADEAVSLAKLPHGTSSNDGKFLRANNGADPSFETVNTDLVADTSPQLGADLDVNDFNIKNGTSLIDITDGGRIEVDIAGTEIVDINGNGVDVVGSVDITGSINLANSIIHKGDTDTKIDFTDNRITLATAGSDRIDVRSDKIIIGHADEITINDEEAIRLNIPTNTDLDNYGNNRDNKGKITICAGNASQTGNPDDNCTVIQITPEETRSTSVNSKHGGIGWQHLSPLNWTGYNGNQIWMGSALHDTAGTERANFQIWMNSQTGFGSQPNNHAFNLSPEGYHSFPKIPCFSAYTSSNVSGNNTVVFDRVNVNNGNHYNNSNGRFTAPEDGFYFFSFYGMGPYSTSNNMRLHIRINNSHHSSGEHYGGVGYSGGSSYNHVTISTLLALSANDYVTIYNNNYDALHDSHNKFNGFKIG